RACHSEFLGTAAWLRPFADRRHRSGRHHAAGYRGSGCVSRGHRVCERTRAPRMKTFALTVAGFVLVLLSRPSFAADGTNGKRLFSGCPACHIMQRGGPNGVGPNLFGVVGRKAGSKSDFSYSAAMKNSGITWSHQKLDAYLAHPAQIVPGNRMAFAG